MKRNYILITIALLISLFFYLFYRTEKTVINEMFIAVFSFDKFVEWRSVITGAFPVNEHIVYSLPEGLWVFCITLTSNFLFIKIGAREINLKFAPLVFSLGLEFFQLLHLTNGRFDVWDIGFSVLFWGIANYLPATKNTKQNLLKPFTGESLICILSYAIVYLAHVLK